MNCCSEKDRIKNYIEKLGVNSNISPKEFAEAIESAIKDRAIISYTKPFKNYILK